MDLDDLEDLFDDLDIEGPTSSQLFTLYGIFLNDIAKKPLVVNGQQVQYNNAKSRHPICVGKALAFEHIITRESKYSNKRNFDPIRANKVHWIRPIIENAGDPRIKYFERVNDKGFNQLFYWYPEKEFIIIIRMIKPNYLLITAFCVDYGERTMFKAWFEEYEKQKKTSLRK